MYMRYLRFRRSLLTILLFWFRFLWSFWIWFLWLLWLHLLLVFWVMLLGFWFWLPENSPDNFDFGGGFCVFLSWSFVWLVLFLLTILVSLKKWVGFLLFVGFGFFDVFALFGLWYPERISLTNSDNFFRVGIGDSL